MDDSLKVNLGMFHDMGCDIMLCFCPETQLYGGLDGGGLGGGGGGCGGVYSFFC